jgi:hypothetical protein
MDTDTLVILHDHYRDTCTVMQGQRAARDRYFYLVLAVLAIVLFDISSPQGFANVIGDILRANLQLSTAPDLGYIRSLLWFLLLGFTVRYCQTALAVERQYGYVHKIEALLSTHVDGAFTREGAAYLADYPLFLDWAHYLYTLVFPLLLSIITVIWTYRQLPGSGVWPWTMWFDGAVTVAMLASICMYLVAFHGRDRRRHTGSQRTRKKA